MWVQWVHNFNKVHKGLLQGPLPPLLGLKPSKKHARNWQGTHHSLLGEGSHSTRTEASMTGKGGQLKPSGMGLGISMISSECACYAGSHMWLYVYAGGRGREMETASSFISG